MSKDRYDGNPPELATRRIIKQFPRRLTRHQFCRLMVQDWIPDNSRKVQPSQTLPAETATQRVITAHTTFEIRSLIPPKTVQRISASFGLHL